MIEKLRSELVDLSELEYKKFNESLCPDTKRKMLGIRIPILRKLAKEIVKNGDWQEFVTNKKIEYFEEVLLQGFIIGYSKIEFKDMLEAEKVDLTDID